jgi:hypothetical protein
MYIPLHTVHAEKFKTTHVIHFLNKIVNSLFFKYIFSAINNLLKKVY